MHNLIIMIFYIYLQQTKRHLKQNYRFKATVKRKKYTSDDNSQIMYFCGILDGPSHIMVPVITGKPVSSIVTIYISLSDRIGLYSTNHVLSTSVLRKLFMQIISVETHSLSKSKENIDSRKPRHFLQDLPKFLTLGNSNPFTK